ncbi:proto-oncogene tyrosine-protein kinase receptor Ret isoform X1 [Lethenteron reissneri]|uniref:proto-oncogene tyrosine-protein kinase receptor Ret isoform X1 n=2 Tax=Lethenteron reissneri TaxID=7753 RepID=UPI002AB7A872|nr:proto-oncogene tyrosine-protein kinase receptor Ret isoform X1 [Lethenteron reissneri]
MKLPRLTPGRFQAVAWMASLLCQGAWAIYFPQKTYHETIPFGFAPNVSFLRLYAVLQAGETGVQFELGKLSLVMHHAFLPWQNHLFDVDAATGDVSLKLPLEGQGQRLKLDPNAPFAFRLHVNATTSRRNSSRAQCGAGGGAASQRATAQATVLLRVTAPPFNCSLLTPQELCFREAAPSPLQPGPAAVSMHLQENAAAGTPLVLLAPLPVRLACPHVNVTYALAQGSLASPFHVDAASAVLRVLESLDRERVDRYRLHVECTVVGGDGGGGDEVAAARAVLPLAVFVDDEDDSAPFLENGTDTKEVVITYNRRKDDLVSEILVHDLDSGGWSMRYKLSSTGPNSESLFLIRDNSRDTAYPVDNRTVTGTTYVFGLVLKKNLPIKFQGEFQAELRATDVQFQCGRTDVLARVRIRVLPVPLAFPAPLLTVHVERRAARLAQVWKACVLNCSALHTATVSYTIAPADSEPPPPPSVHQPPPRGISPNGSEEEAAAVGAATPAAATAAVASGARERAPSACAHALAMTRPGGWLYVNDTALLCDRVRCPELRFTLTAHDAVTGLQASTTLHVVFRGESCVPSPGKCSSSCSENDRQEGCESCSALGAVTGRCQWRRGPSSGINKNYSTCSSNLLTCPDGVCDEMERDNEDLCPQDCVESGNVIGGHEMGYPLGIRAGHGTCYCYDILKCICELPDIEEPGCDEGCRAVVATAGVCSVIIALSLAVTILRRRRQKGQLKGSSLPTAELTFRRQPVTYSSNNNRMPPSESADNLSSVEACKILEDPKWEFPRKNLALGKTLGEGEFGKVVKATAFRLKGKAGYTTVAVKMLKECASHSELRDLLSELNLLKQVNHPNIIRLHGACTQDGPLYLIVEYAKYGSLRSFLRVRRKAEFAVPAGSSNRNSRLLDNPDERGLTLGDLVSFAWQISRGMTYLADMKLVHRDLAARNVLVAEGRKMKISDFGLSRDVYEGDSYVKRTKGRIPVKWMAIESLFEHMYTSQSDVWSFGILLWEIMTLGGTPYPGIPPERLFNLLKTGYRMEKPENCSDDLYGLMQRCWTHDPARRPHFAEISKDLEKMMVKSRDYLDLTAPAASDASIYEDGGSDEGTGEEETPLVTCDDSEAVAAMRGLPATWIENKLYGMSCPDWSEDRPPHEPAAQDHKDAGNAKYTNEELSAVRYANWMVTQTAT